MARSHMCTFRSRAIEIILDLLACPTQARFSCQGMMPISPFARFVRLAPHDLIARDAPL